jgi:hypothetical protein
MVGRGGGCKGSKQGDAVHLSVVEVVGVDHYVHAQ